MFKERKIKKLIEKYSQTEIKNEGFKILTELETHGRSVIPHIIASFQKRKLVPDKAKTLLERFSDNSTIDIIAPLIGDPYDEVRKVAKEMIIKRWRKQSIGFLVEQLKSTDYLLSNNATELLSLFRENGCVNKLISMFNESDAAIKRNIILILSKTGGLKEKRLIITALNDESLTVCLAAMKTLGEMKAQESVDNLIEKLHEDDFRIKKFAMDSLTMIGDKKAVSPMLDLLKDNDMIIRQKATEFLIDYADSDIVGKLIDFMKSSDVNVRRCVVEVLNNLKDPRTSIALFDAIKDSDWWVRQIATESLKSIKGDNIVKGFIAMIQDSDENLRRCAVEYFKSVPNKAAFKHLVALLKDEDWWVREKAIMALGKLKDEKAIASILSMTDDEEVRWIVPGALADIGGDEVIEHLKGFLLDKNRRYKLETIRALEKLKADSAVPNLKECLNDENEDVRSEAVSALKTLTGKIFKIEEDDLRKTTLSPILTDLKEKPVAGSILTEAILVLDLCNSTDITNRYGDNFILNLMKNLTNVVTSIAQREKYNFMKGTGDGFLITFSQVANSIRFAFSVQKSVSNYNEKAEKNKRIDLRFAINFGETKVSENGDRLGGAVNMAFRVECVKPEGLIPIENGMKKEDIPLVNWVFVTENVVKEIKNMKGISTELVGFFELKGITGLHKVFQITT